MPRLSIRYFIIGPILLLVGLSNLFVSNTLIAYSEESQLNNFIEKKFTTTRTILPTLALSIWEFNIDIVNSTLAGLDDNDNFIYSEIIAEGGSFATYGNNAFKTQAEALLSRESEQITQYKYQITNDVFIVTYPIKLEDRAQEIGQMVTVYSLESLRTANKNFANRIRMIAAIATLAVFLGIFIYAWIAIKRLNRLTSSIKNVAAGELNDIQLFDDSKVKEFHEIDRAVQQLRRDALQLIEFKSNSRAADQIKYMALHDPLTNLGNRHSLEDLIQTIEHDSDRENYWLEILHIDLDGFKEVNDKYGHQAGDTVLKVVSERLKSVVDENGYIYRVGGDEFVIIRYHNKMDSDIHRYLPSLPTKINQFIAEPCIKAGRSYTVTTSVGVVTLAADNIDIDMALVDADIAMYAAKAQGKNCFVRFTPSLRKDVLEKQDLAADLERALKTDEIRPYYQPKVSSDTFDLCGAEALARWFHPSRGVLTPDKFMDIAKDRQLVAQIDQRIFQQVCIDREYWQSHGYLVPSISINLSASRLNDNSLIDDVKQADLEPGVISFELLETVCFDDMPDKVIARVDQLRKLGIGIELDDFGNGHASMISLLKIAPSRLKIDRFFVRDYIASYQSRNLLKQIVEIGKSLDIPVTAEGIETPQQAVVLKKLGCDVLQGYYFGKPCSASEFSQEYLQHGNMTKNNYSDAGHTNGPSQPLHN